MNKKAGMQFKEYQRQKRNKHKYGRVKYAFDILNDPPKEAYDGHRTDQTDQAAE